MAESPRHRQSPTPVAAEPRAPKAALRDPTPVSPSQAAEDLGLASSEVRANPVPSPKSTLYLSKLAVLHIEDAIHHRSLHGPSAAPAVSTRMGHNRGYQQLRKCDCCSQSNCMGQTSFSQGLPLSGVWDEGQSLGQGGVCPSALPLAMGQTTCRQSTGNTPGTT